MVVRLPVEKMTLERNAIATEAMRRLERTELGMHTKTIKPVNLDEAGAVSQACAVNPLTIISVPRDSRTNGAASTQCNFKSGEQR